MSTWLVANREPPVFAGAFLSRYQGFAHYFGTRLHQIGPHAYEIIGAPDDPNAPSGLFIFLPEVADQYGFAWAVEAWHTTTKEAQHGPEHVSR